MKWHNGFLLRLRFFLSICYVNTCIEQTFGPGNSGNTNTSPGLDTSGTNSLHYGTLQFGGNSVGKSIATIDWWLDRRLIVLSYNVKNFKHGIVRKFIF